MRFEFATATRIVFGAGTVSEVGSAGRAFGCRALVVTGRTVERAARALSSLASAGVETIAFPVSGEPTTDVVRAGTRQARESNCDLVVAVGGGSAIDAGKAISALVTNQGRLEDYLEVIGAGLALEEKPLPFVAVPTTAGTGAEVTRNAVLASPEQRVKVSLRSPLLLPRLALVDPELTLDLAREITAATGMDALTQLVEAFVSCRANPLVDGLCREGISRAARSLQRACDHPHDLAAREDMAMASLFSGLALANAGLGAVHGFAGPIGGMFPAPHGAVCAALLSVVMEVNLRALRRRRPGCEAELRFAEVGRLLTGRATAVGEDAVAWVAALSARLKIPALGAFGVARANIPILCEKASQSSSMKGNPLPLLPVELDEILARAL